MQDRTKRVIGVAGAVVVAGAVGTGVAVASGDDGPEDTGPDVAITGTALDRASDAALAHTGGGTVTATEAGDEESAYEVEVTLDDGTQIDVQLDASFNVVGDETESGSDD
jgi:uncharacterized membrane protein YkoI